MYISVCILINEKKQLVAQGAEATPWKRTCVLFKPIIDGRWQKYMIRLITYFFNSWILQCESTTFTYSLKIAVMLVQIKLINLAKRIDFTMKSYFPAKPVTQKTNRYHNTTFSNRFIFAIIHNYSFLNSLNLHFLRYNLQFVFVQRFRSFKCLIKYYCLLKW